MKSKPINLRFMMPFFTLILFAACSKDPDILADIVATDFQEARFAKGLVLDDNFISATNQPMTLDVLSNDGFEELENVKIVEVSSPSNGSVVVNEDKTITYTPETEPSSEPDTGSETTEEPTSEQPTREEQSKESTDSFTYTTETENEDQTTTTQTGTVTVTTNKDYGVLKAFPTAYGAGSNASGGRGGEVYHVTNLNNSGVGSFRDAVSKSNRYIVFNVSGVIKLTTDLVIRANNITIAGQTAPLGGISIAGPRVRFVDVDNMIIRYIRFRPVWDHSKWDIEDAVECTRVTNSIFDHISISWGADETISFVGSKGSDPNKIFATYNITLQNSLLGDSAKGMIVGYVNYQDSGTRGKTGGDFSVNNNVFAHISHRFPNPITDDRVDVINNVVHDWRNKFMAMNPPSKIKINIINNYLQRGKQTNDVLRKGKVIHLDYDSNAAQKVYARGNIVNDEFTNENTENLSLFHWWTQGPNGNTQSNPTGTLQVTLDNSSNRFTTNSFPQLGHSFNIMSAFECKEMLPNSVGAFATLDEFGNKAIMRDEIDEEFIYNVKNNIGIDHNYYQDRSKNSRYINYYNSISNTPIESHSTNYDTDRDGMPDEWEKLVFGNLNQTANGDYDSDGYENIEQYINLIDF